MDELLEAAVIRALQKVLPPSLFEEQAQAIANNNTIEYESADQAAHRTGLSAAYWRNLARRGEIPTFGPARALRLKKTDVDAFMSRTSQGSARPVDLDARAARLLAKGRQS